MADELTIVKSEPLRVVSGPSEQPPQSTSALNEYWKNHPNQRQLAVGTLNTLPMVGAVGGGVLAAPETMGAGAVWGTAVGAGAGRGLRDLLAEGLKLEPETTPYGKAARIGIDTALAAATPAATAFVKRLFQEPKEVVADVLDIIGSPSKTLSSTADALRAQSAAANAARPILTRPPEVPVMPQEPTPMSPRLASQPAPRLEQELANVVNEIRSTPSAQMTGGAAASLGQPSVQPNALQLRTGTFQATLPDKWGVTVVQPHPMTPDIYGSVPAIRAQVQALVDRGMSVNDALMTVARALQQAK